MLGASLSAAAQGPTAGVEGTVRASEKAPIADAHVFAYALSDFHLTKVVTDVLGSFRLGMLPAGLYQIVAYKAGFIPAVVALTRPTADRQQILELSLVREPEREAAGEDYWEVRNQIPPDVLREIETLEVLRSALIGADFPVPDRFAANLEAQTGVDDIAALGGAAQRTRTGFGVSSQFDRVAMNISGELNRLETDGSAQGDAELKGTANSLSLGLSGSGSSRFNLSTSRNHLVLTQDGQETPVDFEHLRLSYSTPIGSRGHSAFSAQVTDETNFYRSGEAVPIDVPGASKTLELGGTYSLTFSERSMIEGGLSYRARESNQVGGRTAGDLSRDRVDLFGRGGYRLRPAMLIEFGVYSVLRDGQLALTPQGGLVLQLNPHWQLSAKASGRVNSFNEDLPGGQQDFLPVYFGETPPACQEAEKQCYQVALARSDGDNLISLGAVHREFGETLRLYFSQDFFDRSESVYVVPGDRLDELQVSLTRRLSPNILTRLRSNVAAGGGGTFLATLEDGYQNEVRYVITSLDTHFQSTSTGVFLAFHQLHQSLEPLGSHLLPLDAIDSERLELRVQQDLKVLLDLPADWALQLHMELARNGEEGSREVRRRVLGGIAVKF